MKKVVLSVAIMELLRKLTFLVILLLCINYVFAQEISRDFSVIYRSDSVFVQHTIGIDDNTFLAFGGTNSGSGGLAIMKITYEGEILDSVSLPNRMDFWVHGNYMNGKFRYASFRYYDNDTLPLLCAVDVDPEDLSVTYTGYNWEGLDFNHPQQTHLYTNQIYPVFLKDGSLLLSYSVDSLYMVNGMQSVHLVKFDNNGDFVKERIFDGVTGLLSNLFFITPDSLGCRIITKNANLYKFECHTLDEDLNTVSVVENAGMVYYSSPYLSGWLYCISECPTHLCVNPHNGRTYSICSDVPLDQKEKNETGKGKMDILMGVYDENFNLLNWTWGISTPEGNDDAVDLDIGPNGEVYMLGWMDLLPSMKGNGQYRDTRYMNFYVGYLDEDLNKYSEIYFKPEEFLYLKCISACHSGGCIVSSRRNDDITGQTIDHCIFRITPEDFLNVEEAHSHGFAVATAYPNPGKDVLYIRTGLWDARVEVYDMNGRMVYRQEITENVTSINAERWPAGAYVWKVVAEGMEVESGKWIKE